MYNPAASRSPPQAKRDGLRRQLTLPNVRSAAISGSSSSTSTRPNVHPAATKGLPAFKDLDPVIGSETIQVKSAWRPSPILERRPTLGSLRSGASRSGVEEPSPREPHELPVRGMKVSPSWSFTAPSRPPESRKARFDADESSPFLPQTPPVAPSQLQIRSFTTPSRHHLEPHKTSSRFGEPSPSAQEPVVLVSTFTAYSRHEIPSNKVRYMVGDRSTSATTPQSAAVPRAVAAFEAKSQISPSSTASASPMYTPTRAPGATRLLGHAPFHRNPQPSASLSPSKGPRPLGTPRITSASAISLRQGDSLFQRGMHASLGGSAVGSNLAAQPRKNGSASGPNSDVAAAGHYNSSGRGVSDQLEDCLPKEGRGVINNFRRNLISSNGQEELTERHIKEQEPGGRRRERRFEQNQRTEILSNLLGRRAPREIGGSQFLVGPLNVRKQRLTASPVGSTVGVARLESLAQEGGGGSINISPRQISVADSSTTTPRRRTMADYIESMDEPSRSQFVGSARLSMLLLETLEWRQGGELGDEIFFTQPASTAEGSDGDSVSSVSTSILDPQDQSITAMNQVTVVESAAQDQRPPAITDQATLVDPAIQYQSPPLITDQATIVESASQDQHPPAVTDQATFIDPAFPERPTPEEERISRHLEKLNDLFAARVAMDRLEDKPGLVKDKLTVFKPIFPYLAKNWCPIILEKEMLHWAFICVHDDGFDPLVVHKFYEGNHAPLAMDRNTLSRLIHSAMKFQDKLLERPQYHPSGLPKQFGLPRAGCKPMTTMWNEACARIRDAFTRRQGESSVHAEFRFYKMMIEIADNIKKFDRAWGGNEAPMSELKNDLTLFEPYQEPDFDASDPDDSSDDSDHSSDSDDSDDPGNDSAYGGSHGNIFGNGNDSEEEDEEDNSDNNTSQVKVSKFQIGPDSDSENEDN